MNTLLHGVLCESSFLLFSVALFKQNRRKENYQIVLIFYTVFTLVARFHWTSRTVMCVCVCVCVSLFVRFSLGFFGFLSEG